LAFSPEEIAYLQSQPLARLATRSPEGHPDVVPVAFEFDGSYFWIGGSGASVLDTRKFRNVLAGNPEVAFVVDDMVSFDPFIARGIRVYGRAEGPIQRVGMVGARSLHGHNPYGLLELEHGGKAGGQQLVRVEPGRPLDAGNGWHNCLSRSLLRAEISHSC
jgi:pyridoxamine 5'-phosphate oxidase family protein